MLIHAHHDRLDAGSRTAASVISSLPGPAAAHAERATTITPVREAECWKRTEMTVLEETQPPRVCPSNTSWLPPAPGSASSRPAPATSLSIEIIEDRQGFNALKPEEWDRFNAKARTVRRLPFQSHAWLARWCDTSYLDRRGAASLHLAITVVRQDDTACLISPLAVERDYGLISLVWMGAPASQYGDVLLDHGRTSATEIAVAFRHGLDHVGPDVIRLRRVRADAVAAPLLRSEKATVTETNFAPFIDLSTTSTNAVYAERHGAQKLAPAPSARGERPRHRRDHPTRRCRR